MNLHFFQDTSKTAIDFKDREKLTISDSSTGNHYYTNLLTNDGNVVPPFQVNLIYDTTYKQDTNGNNPGISSSPVLKATYNTNNTSWTKTIELSFFQDIYNVLGGVTFNVTNSTQFSQNLSTLTDDKIILTMTNLDDVTSQAVTNGTIFASYNNPDPEAGASYPFINKLYNWFGFEIPSFNSQLVNDSNNEPLPTIVR